MKIDSKGPLNPNDAARLDKAKNVEKASVSQSLDKASEPVRIQDFVEARLSRAIAETLDAIQKSGLTAGEVHSNMDEARAVGLLQAMDVEARRPRMLPDELLALADSVSDKMLSDPQKAASTFQSLESARVSDLLSSS